MKFLTSLVIIVSTLCINQIYAQNTTPDSVVAKSLDLVSTDNKTGTKFLEVAGRKYIDPVDANKYVNKYQNRKQKRVNKKAGLLGGHRDAKSIYFDMAKLDTIIKQGKAASKTFCGLRFYYGKYPRNHMYTDTIANSCSVTPSKKEYNIGLSHTLLIVPVEINSEGQVADIKVKDKNGKIYVLVFGVLVENQGVLCPPMPASYCKAQYLGYEK